MTELDTAYRVRVEKLQQIVMARLLPRRERLVSLSRWCGAAAREEEEGAGARRAPAPARRRL